MLYQDLRTAEVAELEDARGRIEQQILWLDVAVADALRVDIGKGAEELIDVELHFEYGHCSLHLVEIARCPVHGFGNVFEYEIQVDLVLLSAKSVHIDSIDGSNRLTRSPFE